MSDIWYASSHSFGHITRVMANIEKKFENDNFSKIILVSGKNQIELYSIYLKQM